MKLKMIIVIFFLLISGGSMLYSYNVGTNVQVTHYNNPSPGYMFFGPTDLNGISLLDNCGKLVHSSSLYHTKLVVNLEVQNNYLTYYFRDMFGSFAGYLAVNENYETIDTFTISSAYQLDNHEFRLLSNGSYIVLGGFTRMVDMSQIVPNGRPNALIRGYIIQIKDSNDNVVFSWNTFDHFSVTDATDAIDLTTDQITPFHCNSVELDSDGNLLLSSRHSDEVTKISTTTGDIIWRMGGSKCKNNQFRFINDTRDNFFGFSHQHDVRRLSNGHILMFDNGNLKNPAYSRAVEYAVDEVNKTVTKVWEYRHNPSIYTSAQGSAQRLPNGNTLINWSGNVDAYLLTEVTSTGSTALEIKGTAADENYRILKYVFNMAAKELSINNTGTFDFNGGTKTSNTNTSFKIDSLTGNGKLLIEKHDYTAHSLSYNGTAPQSVFAARWVMKNYGITRFSGKLTFNLDDISDFANPIAIRVFYRDREGAGAFTQLNTTYNVAGKTIEARARSAGEYILGIINIAPPQLTSPVNNAKDINTTIKFEWDNISSASSYRFQISLNSNFTSFIFDSSNITTNYINYSNLQQSKKYYWRVLANYSSVLSDWSEIRNFSTYLLAPKLNSPVDSTFNNDLNGVLSWTKNPSAHDYIVQISDNLQFSKIINIDTTDKDIFSYSGLNFNSKYFWRVRSKSDITLSEWSLTRIFTTHLDTTDLLVPSNLSVNTGMKKLQFIWNSLQGANGYRFQLSESKNFELITDDFLVVSDTAYITNKTINPFTNYFWRVSANNGNNTGYWSKVFTFRTMLETPELLLPFNNSKNVKLNLDLNWGLVFGAEKYHFQLSKDNVFSDLILDSILTEDNEIRYFGLEYDKSYFWRVKAFSDSAFSEWSEANKFTTQKQFYVSEPNLVFPGNMTFNQTIRLSFNWEPVPSANKYNFEISKDSTFKSNVLTVSGLSGTSTQEIDLFHNTQYYWRVKAFTPQNASDWSQIYTFYTKLELPVNSTPSNKQEKVRLKPTFGWSEVFGANSYKLQISTNTDFIQNVEHLTKITNYTPDQALELNTNYFWRVKGINGQKESDWSETFSFTTTDVNAISDLASIPEILISPNPFNEYFDLKVNLDSYENVKIEISGINGQLIQKLIVSGNEPVRINTENIETGVYMISVIYSGSRKTIIALHIK